MFTFEVALSTLIYSGAFMVVMFCLDGAVMSHRNRNAKNEQMYIDAELAQLKIEKGHSDTYNYRYGVYSSCS